MTTQPTQTSQEIQINKAMKALDDSAKQQQVAVDVLNGFRDELGSLNEHISVASIQLSELKTDHATQVRENAIKLNIAVRKIESRVLNSILEKHGLVALAETDLYALIKRAEVAIAQLKANSSADAKHIEQLEAQVESLEAKAQAELDARIEIAKAESNKQGVTVNTGK